MKINTPGVPPSQWLDGTQMTYMNWREGQAGCPNGIL